MSVTDKRLAVLVLAAVVAVVPTVRAADGAASIEALWVDLTALSKPGGDFCRLIPLVHPDDRAGLGIVLMLAGAMTPMAFADDAAKTKRFEDEWNAIVKKHGIESGGKVQPANTKDEMLANARRIFAKVDLAAFCADSSALTTKYAPKDKQQAAALPGFKGKLAALKVTGDSASATADGEPVKFGRVNGRWYLRME